MTSPVGVATVVVAGALLRRRRIRNEWDCVGLARCIDRASRWLLDTPEATSFLDTLARILHVIERATLHQLSDSRLPIDELAHKRQHTTGRASSSPAAQFTPVTSRDVDDASGSVLDSNVSAEGTERRGARRALVDHVTIDTLLAMHVVGCALSNEAAQKKLDALGRVDMRVTASVRYGDVSLGDTCNTSAAKSDSRSYLAWDETLQFDVLISALPREACLDVRLCAVSPVSGAATTL
jgi:hypothetical protein